MDVVLLRHAKAEERSVLRRDRSRALTRAGRRDMARVAKGLRRLVSSFDVIASSPLTRARQTAAMLADRYGGRKIVEVPELVPGGKPEALVCWLRGLAPDAVVALIGHEPDLGRFAARLLTGRAQPFLPLKKAGACLIRFDGNIEAGSGELIWALPPGALRALA